MNWLKNKVIKWVREDQDNVRDYPGSRDCDATPCEEDPILNFRVFSAVGGQVVEFRRYDRKTKRSESTTYIVHKDDDFGDKIAKVANLEMLK